MAYLTQQISNSDYSRLRDNAQVRDNNAACDASKPMEVNSLFNALVQATSSVGLQDRLISQIESRLCGPSPESSDGDPLGESGMIAATRSLATILDSQTKRLDQILSHIGGR